MWNRIQIDPKWKSNTSQKWPRVSTERSLFYARKERPHQKDLGAQMDIKFLPIWPEMVLQTWIWVQMEPKWKSNASQKLRLSYTSEKRDLTKRIWGPKWNPNSYQLVHKWCSRCGLGRSRQRTAERRPVADDITPHHEALRHLLVHWNVAVFHRLGYPLLHQRCCHYG